MAGPLQVALPQTVTRGRFGADLATAAPFLMTASATGLLAGDRGGYWPTTWGWAALALAWSGGLALTLRGGWVSRLELYWIGGLIALTIWTALSLLWTGSKTETMLEVERALVYVLAAIAVVAVTRPASYRSVLWGAWVGSTLACMYGLATRLFPERLGVVDVVAGYRLSSPLGYWNGLGLLAAIALTLALGLSINGPVLARATAAASAPPLATTLYFTFSRGAWVALAAAILAAVAFSNRRLAHVSALLVLAVPAAVAVWLSYREKPLRSTNVPLDRAVHAGHSLAWQLGLVSIAAAGLASAYIAAARLHMGRRIQRGLSTLLAAGLVGGCAVLVVHYGGPAAIVSHARHSLESSGPPAGTDLSARLFSLSSNGRLRQWHVALDEWHQHPLLGGGAGTYGEYWAAAGKNQPQLLDVHNLYLEMLAELGPVGLGLLGLVLLTPLVAAVRARRFPLVPIAAGAYVAWLIHVAYDWDWELPGVTVAALVSAGAILAAARRPDGHQREAFLRAGLLTAVVAAGAMAFFGLLGNRALAQTGDALRHGDVTRALATAEDARRWAPWSSQPWLAIAGVRRAQGDRAAEIAAYQRAVEKDPRDWELWLDLFSVSRGADRTHALSRLALLNPGVAAVLSEAR